MCTETIQLPSPAQMAQRLSRILPRFTQVRWVQQTGSTNPDLMHQARNPDGQIVRPWLLGAHHQTQGRGRGGKTWDNAPGTQLMFSCAFDVFLPSRQLPTLSPLMGVAACQALRGLLPPFAQQTLCLKWPNDIMWGHAKMAGILTEVTRASTARLSADHFVVVVGIGINLRQGQQLSEKLNRPIADWGQLCQTHPQVGSHQPEHIVAAIAHRWWQQLNLVTTSGLGHLVQEYQDVDYLYRLPIDIVHDGQITHSGIAAGINARGQLLVQMGTHTKAVSVGEISIHTQHQRLGVPAQPAQGGQP